MSENVIGFSIEIKGSESELNKMTALKRELIDVEKEITKLKNSTKDNVGAQKASAERMAELSIKAKLLKSDYNALEKALIENATGVTKLKEEQKKASEEAKQAAIEQKKLANEEKQLAAETKRLAREEAKLANERKKAQAEIEKKILKEEQLRAKHTHLAGSYNALVLENKKLSEQLRSLPIDKTNKDFNDLQRQLNENTVKLKQFDSEIGRSFRNVGNYGESLKSIAVQAGLVFGINEIKNFGSEAIQMAAKMEGIERAFQRLNRPGLLDELRAATKGTVSDMELMKAAVNANNFQIPLETMASLLKFAQQRAQETGQSVEYLTESIVTGIARKSPLILDNLGINVQRINAKFKETGDFAKAAGIIVEQELTKQGDLALTTADKIDRLSVRWNNFKTAVGEALITAGAGFEDLLMRISGNKNEAMEKVAQSVTGTKQFYKKEFDSIVETAKLSEANRLKAIKDNEVQIKLALESAQQTKSASLRASYSQEVIMRKQLNDSLLNLNKEFAKQYTDEELKAMEEARKKKEEEIKKNNELILRLSDDLAKGQLELMNAGLEKDVASVEVKYNLEIEGLKRQLVNKKKLREDEIKLNEAINNRILQLEKIKQKEINDLGNKAIQDNNKIAKHKLDLEEQIAIEEVKQGTGNEREKQEQILAIRKEYAQKQLDLLEETGKLETLEGQAQAAKLRTVLAEELKPEKGKSPMEMAFGTDKDAANAAINSAVELAKKISDMLFDQQRERNQRLLQNQLEAIKQQADMESTILENKLENGLITEQQYAQEKKEIDAKQRQEELEAKKKAFEKEKELKKKQILIELALELIKIASAYANIPYVGWATAAIQAGAATAAAGVQIAAIENQQFKKGGVVRGPSHEQGGIPFSVEGRSGFEMEGDEIIMTKGVYRNPILRQYASAINVMGGGRSFAMGGPPAPSSTAPQTFPLMSVDMESFAMQIVRGINNKKVYNVATETAAVNGKIQNIEMESSF